MNISADILISGSGSLATEILHALALVDTPLHVWMVGRTSTRLEELRASALGVAATWDKPIRVTVRQLDWNSEDSIAGVIEECSPKLIAHTASLQSPWILDHENEWCRLVSRAGFGLTLPLQAALALKLARVCKQIGYAGHFVNFCYPDAVNPLICASGLPVTCGSGNVTILASLLASRLRSSLPLRIIAHHAHVSALVRGGGTKVPIFPAWLGPEEIQTQQVLMGVKIAPNLNRIVAASSIRLLLSLLGLGEEWAGHCVAPSGLPGGYPVIARSSGVTLDLPHQTTLEDAVQLNDEASRSDGVSVDQNSGVTFTQNVHAELARYGIAGRAVSGSAGQDLEKLLAHLLGLREILLQHRTLSQMVL
jgi:hypothetical protein